MTTIAYRDGIMAADSQNSDEGYLEKTPCRKIYRVKRDLIGLAQGTFAGLLFLEYIKGKLSAEDLAFQIVNEDDFLAMVIRKGRIMLFNRYLVPDSPPESYDFWAIGSGGKIALGAMEMGATAEEAVKVASKYDLFTSGAIVTEKANRG